MYTDKSHVTRKDTDITEEASIIDTNTASEDQPGVEDPSCCPDQKPNDTSSTERANDTPPIDQRADDVHSTDQKANDIPPAPETNGTPLMDQRAKDTTVADQEAEDTPSTDQQVNDTDQKLNNTIPDQEAKDTPTEYHDTTHKEDFNDQKDDTSEVEVSPEEITKFLVPVTPYLIPRSDLTCITNSGTTMVAKWYNNTDCSLQEFNLDFTKPEGRRKFGKYLSVCAALAKLRHPNIQQLLGFVSQDRESTEPLASIVTEINDLTLTKMLTNHKHNEIQTTTHINICYDVAKAVSYLHLSKLSHLLIRSDCVMLTRDNRAKLCDIASSLLYQAGLSKEVEMINANYLPPDEMVLGASSNKTDAFSIGVLYLQTITHVAPNPVPIDEIHRTEIERRQDHIDLVHSSHPLLTLIITCLSNKPEDRPTDEEICSVLQASLNTEY